MPKVEIHGQSSLAYRERGDGPPVVLVHGFPFSSALWEPQLVGLSDRFRVIAPDLRGFGESDLADGPYGMDVHADDLAALLDALGLERVVLGGLSMGGYVAFEFVRRHRDRLRGLILADTRAEPDTAEGRANRRRMARTALEEGTDPVIEPMVPKLLSPETREARPEVEERLLEIMRSARPEAIAAALEGMAGRADSRDLLPRIEVPTLVIGGADDAITPAADLRAMAEAIPDVRLELLAGAGHVSNLEAPERFNAAVRDFLDEVR